MMVGGRGGGKTHQCMLRFRDDSKAVLMVANAVERERIIEQYDLDDEEAARVWTPSKGRLLGSAFPVNLIIDNLDLVLFGWLGTHPSFVTITGDVDSVRQEEAHGS